MYCPSCGAFNPDNSKFCAGCGARFQTVQVPVAPAKKQKNTSIMARLLLAFGIIVLLCLFANKIWEELESTFGKTTNTSEKAPVTTPAPTQQKVYNLGETVRVHNLEFTVTGYTFSKYAGALGTLNPADDDTVYCVVYVTVRNPTDTAQRISSETITGSYSLDYSSDLVFDGAYTYYSSFAEYKDFLFVNDSVLPLGTLSDKIINFRVPVNIQNSDAPITIKIRYLEDEYAVWQIR